MRLDINLASHPYEDARRFWMVWGTAVSLVAALTLVLLTLDVSGWIFARRDHHDMQQKRALIADRDRIRAEAQSFLNPRQIPIPERTDRAQGVFVDEGAGESGKGDAAACASGLNHSEADRR